MSIKAYDNNPSQSGILKGICKGECWINEKETLAITYSYPVGGCGVFGRIEDKGRDFRFFEETFGKLKAMHIDWFEYATEDLELDQGIMDMFSEKQIDSEVEYSYRIYSAVEVIGDCPDDYEIVPIISDETMNAKMVAERMEVCWNSKDDFLKESLGYIAVYKGEIVGIIFGSGKYKNYIAVDIEVKKEHRKRGVAKHLTKTFVNACMDRKLIPHWDCVESNRASIALAESVGFEIIKKRAYHWFGI